MGSPHIPDWVHEKYEVREWRHAAAILKFEFPEEWRDVKTLLQRFRLRKSWIDKGGGRKSGVSNYIDDFLANRGWTEKSFEVGVQVDDKTRESPTHAVDCYKNRVALEIEWNNKDPFFDRDLNNFRLLFDLQAISVGIIVTRGDDLQEIFKELGRGQSYGASTTHMSKLLPRINGGGGGGCPILAFGIRKELYSEGC